MPFLYDLGLKAYAATAKAAAAFNPKARKWTEGQQQLLAEIQGQMQAEKNPVVWFHCASLGEFEQGRPLMEAFRTEFPEHKICLTFFSPSGYEIRKNYAGADHVFYLPLDTKDNAPAFVNAVKPRLAVFVKYEFWHYYLQALAARKIPAISVSAIFRPNQLFFRRYGGFYRNLLRQFSHLFVQNKASAYLLAGHKITNVTVAGDTRFDRVSKIPETAQEIPIARAFAEGAGVMVIGSSWPHDMEHLVPFMQAHRQLKFIVAPHEMHENQLQELEQKFPGETARFTKTKTEEASQKRILIIDTIGLLSSLYQYGKYAYVGGAFGKGLHNILEAATFGLPLFFGPNYTKFQEANDLIGGGGAFTINNLPELEAAFARLNQSESAYALAAETCRNYVRENTGATEAIMKYIRANLSK